MSPRSVLVRVSFALLFAIGAVSASAQATRTWVSGVGDDANPCSRTAPCKTFAGAISKTAAGGEISVLDPGSYGAVTITKSIVINGTGNLAGILASGTNGIVVNAGVNDVVTIRDISIECTSTGLDGIRFLGGAALHVEDSTIRGCSESGIDFQPAAQAATSAAQLHLRNVHVGNVTSAPTGDAGISLRPAAGRQAVAVIEDSRIDGNKIGLRVEARANVVVRDSSLSGNSNNGIAVISSTDLARATIEGSTLNFNGVGGSATAGVKVVGASSIARLSGNVITGNDVGLLNSGGQIVSFGDNVVSGNNLVDGTPTSTAPKI